MNWQETDTIIPLTSNTIQVYLVDIDQLNCQYFRLHQDEKIQADSMPIEKYRQRFINARGFLRFLLNTTEPFAKADKGKLSLANSNVFFNLAHSQQLAIYAVNYNDEIGIDIEAIREIKDTLAIGQRVFSSDEQAYLANSATNEFFTLWARKEAVIKTTGEGLGAPLKQINTNNTQSQIISPVIYPQHSSIELIDIPQIKHFSSALAGCLTGKAIHFYRY
jgi:4'-phosphopantetheinyl transferase